MSRAERWNRLIGPVILVYVDFKSEKAWWTDLKDEDSYSTQNKSIILVSKNQRFGIHSFGNFKKLRGYLRISPELKVISVCKEDVCYFNYTKNTLKESAKDFYKKWAESESRNNPVLGEVIVSREGWRHISRKGRKSERIIQSWTLLGVAKRIIQEVDNAYQLRVFQSKIDNFGNYIITDFISLRSRIIFPQRHSSVIQVILKRKRKFNSENSQIENKIRFYSVYEPLSGRNVW